MEIFRFAKIECPSVFYSNAWLPNHILNSHVHVQSEVFVRALKQAVARTHWSDKLINVQEVICVVFQLGHSVRLRLLRKCGQIGKKVQMVLIRPLLLLFVVNFIDVDQDAGGEPELSEVSLPEQNWTSFQCSDELRLIREEEDECLMKPVLSAENEI